MKERVWAFVYRAWLEDGWTVVKVKTWNCARVRRRGGSLVTMWPVISTHPIFLKLKTLTHGH